jgi:hypothetical protein
MTKLCISLFLSFIVCLLSLEAALAQERGQQVKMAELPAAVQKTVREQSQGAKIEELSKVVEKGKTIYTVEMIVNGRTKEVLLDPDGKVIALEEQIALEALPPVVKAGIEQQAGNGKIVKAESITKGDAIVGYEAHIKRDGKLTEIRVGPDGKSITKEE